MEGVHDYHKTSIDIIVSQENITNADYTKTTKQIFSFVQMQKTQPASYIAIFTFNARFMSVLFKAEQFT